MSEDIRSITSQWPYEPGKVTVRRVMGNDGLGKIQIRLDLGLLQLENAGRPDGKRPFSFESLLHYYEHKLQEYRQKHQSDLAFELNAEDCRQLREEAALYYHRYLACFVLEDFQTVVRDTERNLQVFDLCRRYAENKTDRTALEQHRPYVVMMNARAKSHIALHGQNYKKALLCMQSGLRLIKKYFEDIDQAEQYAKCTEVKVLRRLGRSIRRKMPVSPVKALQRKLQEAVAREEFEKAAELSRRIEHLQNKPRNQNKDQHRQW